VFAALFEFRLYGLLKLAKHRNYDVWREEVLMPKLKNRFPKVCRDRNQAFSWHNGRRIYHGVWGTSEAEKSYKRFIAALLENPVLPVRMDGDGAVLVSELATGYLDHIENSPMHPSHVLHFKSTVGYLVELYGELAVNEFSPKKLKAVRSQMVKTGKLCRKMVNDYARRIVCIFQWGVEEELVQDMASRFGECAANARGSVESGVESGVEGGVEGRVGGRVGGKVERRPGRRVV